MSKEAIIGRKKEQKELDWCMTTTAAQLVVVQGRRRIGKTFLITQYFDNTFDFRLTGSYCQPKHVQLRNFSDEMCRRTGNAIAVPKDWTEAFFVLRQYLEELPQDRKQVVFFDEMPWMDTAKSGFLPAFEYFWNDYGSTKDNLVFIVCGSASSWLSDHIAHNKGGLFNRVTCSLMLDPFTLRECEEFLEKRGFLWSRYVITVCYMILGGIPYYLNFLRNTMTLEENIDALFFHHAGKLRGEFLELFRTLFTNTNLHAKIVEVLSTKRSGMTMGEIAEKAKIPHNGDLKHCLENLMDSGFVRCYRFFGNKKKNLTYQLCDPFTLFYFHFLKNQEGRDEAFWRNSQGNAAIRTWKGLAFENVCMDHLEAIKKTLRVDHLPTECSVWHTAKDEEHDGAQIDMLLDRQDHIINLFELKFSEEEYAIDAKYEKSLRNKLSVFRYATGTKKALHLTMVTTYGLLRNKYSEICQEQITLDDLFL
ncbi:MAG: AAA family ATPase [Spirochaetales bacterium]|nr:AAA family ATPase [Candidatus Physcosoma equi]